MRIPFVPRRRRVTPVPPAPDGDAGASGLRRLIAQADGSGYRSFPSLAAAQAAESAWVVLEGDYGGGGWT